MSPEIYMRRCLDLAQLAKGHTTPNPMVGAVLVHNERIIGEGWHTEYGKAHAEVHCLESVANEDRYLIPQSTMYVSLEPCAHYGKTPPCALRLVYEKVKEVIIANIDPFEKVGGKGIDILKQNDVEVKTGLLEKEGAWVNRRFFSFHTKNRPYIILKWAQTKQGFFAPPDRSRFQITNAASQALVHKWRTEESAIMVGTNTAMYDNPQLTARTYTGNQPLRIVLDTELKIPASHHVFNADAETWIINQHKEERDGNIHFVRMDLANVLPQLLSRLQHHNILSLIVEGGASLLQSFILLGLWDEARVFTGQASLPHGISAPILNNSVPAYATELDGDMLNVFTNKNNPYTYIKGMQL